MSGNNMAPGPISSLTSRGTVALGYVRRSKESGARSISLEDQEERIADAAVEAVAKFLHAQSGSAEEGEVRKDTRN